MLYEFRVNRARIDSKIVKQLHCDANHYVITNDTNMKLPKNRDLDTCNLWFKFRADPIYFEDAGAGKQLHQANGYTVPYSSCFWFNSFLRVTL